VRALAAGALVGLALAPASAGPSATRPGPALTATPTRLTLAGAQRATLTVTNPGATSLVVDVGRAGFLRDRRGGPLVAPRDVPRAAATWLGIRPARFVLRPGARRALTVTARLPRGAEPGDHDALVLLTTRPLGRAGVAVRMRIGVVVVVRAPGRVVRRLILGPLRVRRLRHARVLEVLLVNRGNVTEILGHGSVRVTLARGTTRVTERAGGRELRPRTSGVVLMPLRTGVHGAFIARVEVAAESGRAVLRRTSRIRV
jgi:hypothetical protein